MQETVEAGHQTSRNSLKLILSSSSKKSKSYSAIVLKSRRNSKIQMSLILPQVRLSALPSPRMLAHDLDRVPCLILTKREEDSGKTDLELQICRLRQMNSRYRVIE